MVVMGFSTVGDDFASLLISISGSQKAKVEKYVLSFSTTVRIAPQSTFMCCRTNWDFEKQG